MQLCFSLLVMECLREELLLSWTPWTKLSSQLHCLLFWRFCSSLDIGNSFTMSAWKKSSWKLKSLKAARINNWRIFIKPLQLNYQSSEQRIPPLIQNCMFLESYNFGAKSTVRFWMVYYACNLEPCILLSNVWQSSGEPGAEETIIQWSWKMIRTTKLLMFLNFECVYLWFLLQLMQNCTIQRNIS